MIFQVCVVGLAVLVMAAWLPRPLWPAEMLLGLFPQLALLGAACAVWLAGVGRPGLAAAALLIAAAAFFGVTKSAPLAPAAEGEPLLKIVWANVYGQPDSLRRVIAFARKEVADAVLIAEAPRYGGASAIEDEFYPYTYGMLDGGDTAITVFSRKSVENILAPDSPGRNGLTMKLRGAGGDAIPVGAVHPTIPRSPATTLMRSRQIADVFSLLDNSGALVIGDFNTPPWSPELRRIADAAGAQRLSIGLSSTWMSKLPGLGLPIDHAFVVGAVRGRARVGPPIGSDHFPLLIEVTETAAN